MLSSRSRTAVYAIAIVGLLSVSTLTAALLYGPDNDAFELGFGGSDGFGVQGAHAGSMPPLLQGETDPDGNVRWVRTFDTGPSYVQYEMVEVYAGSLETTHVTIAGVGTFSFSPLLDVYDQTYGAVPFDQLPNETDVDQAQDDLQRELHELLTPEQTEEPEPEEPAPTPLERLCGTGVTAPSPDATATWTCRVGTGNTTGTLQVAPTLEQVTFTLHHTSGDDLTYTATPFVVHSEDASGNLIDLMVRNPIQQADIPGATTLQIPHTYCDGATCITLYESSSGSTSTSQSTTNGNGNGNGNGKGQSKGKGNNDSGADGSDAEAQSDGAAAPVVCPAGATCDDTHYTFVVDPGQAFPVQRPGLLLHLWSEGDERVGIRLLDGEPVYLQAPAWTGDPFTRPGLSASQTDAGVLARVFVDLPTSTSRSYGFEIGGPALLEALYPGPPASYEGSLESLRFRINPLGMNLVSDASLFETFDVLTGTMVATWATADDTARAIQIHTLADSEPVVTIRETGDGAVIVAMDAVDAGLTYAEHAIATTPGELDALLGEGTGLADGLVITLQDTIDGETDAAISLVSGALGCQTLDQGCLGVIVGGITGPVPDEPVPTVADDPTGLLGEPGGAGSPGIENPLGDDGDPTGALLGGQEVPGGDTLVTWFNTISGTATGLMPDPSATDPPECLVDLPMCVGTLDPSAYQGAAVGFIDATRTAVTAVRRQVDEDAVGVYDGDGNELLFVSGGRISFAGTSITHNDGPFLRIEADGADPVCVDHTVTEPDTTGATFPSITLGCPGADTHIVFQPGLTMTWNERDTRLERLVVPDPTDPGAALFDYKDDGSTVTVSTMADHVAGTWQHPSAAIRIDGNPLTQSHFTIGAGEESLGPGMFDSLTLLKQVYALGRPLAANVPDGVESLVFDMVEPPASKLALDAGPVHLNGTDGFDGGDWTSGRHDQQILATVRDDAPERARFVYRFGAAPTPDDGTWLPLNVVSYSGPMERQRTHAATVSSSSFDGADTLQRHFALTWTQRIGPIEVVLWDDQQGDGYGYKVDNSAPGAHLDAPASVDAEDATFRVSWTAGSDTGSGVGGFVVRTATGDTPHGDTGWTPWIDGRPVNEDRSALFQGASGATHHFQVRACDRAGNCGAWSDTRTVEVDDVSTALPPAVAVQATAPAEGATLEGAAHLSWQAAGGGNADRIVTVHVRDLAAGGGSWSTLYSGTARSHQWDTSTVFDGAYVLRYTVSDGASFAQDVVNVVVDNDRARPSLSAVSGGSSDINGSDGTIDDEPGDDERGSPSVGMLVGVLAMLGAAVFVARRVRSA